MARSFTFPADLVEVIEDEVWTDEQRGKIALAAMRIAQDGEMPDRTDESMAWWLTLRMVRDRLVASADAIERGRRGGKSKAAAMSRYASGSKKADETASEQGKERKGKGSKGKKSRDEYASARKKIIEHLNKVTGASYRPGSAATRRNLDARLREGFTVEQLTSVIDTKAAQWLNDEKMRAFLRPQTLFGSKCEGYVAEGATAKAKPSNDRQGWGREA